MDVRRFQSCHRTVSSVPLKAAVWDKAAFFFFTRTTSTGRDEQTRKNKNKINQPVHNEVMYCTNADDDGSDGELYCGRDSEPRQLVEYSKPDFHKPFYMVRTRSTRQRPPETIQHEREREQKPCTYIYSEIDRVLSSCALVPSAGDCRERDGRRHRQRAAKRRARGRRLLEAAALGVVVDGPGEFQRLAALPHHYLLPPHPVLLCLEARLILFAPPPPLGPGGLPDGSAAAAEERHDGARRQGRRERLPRARAPVQPPSRPRQLPRARAHQRRHRLRKARSHCPRPRSSSPPFYLYSTVPCSLMAFFLCGCSRHFAATCSALRPASARRRRRAGRGAWIN
jgi:hypothetical protein